MLHRSWPIVDPGLDDHTGRKNSAMTGETKMHRFPKKILFRDSA